MAGPAPPGKRALPTESPRETATRDLLLVLLTFAAGTVDVLSYVGLGEIFTANMTGNTVFLALAVGQGSVGTALRSADALLFFSAGAVVAGRLLRRPRAETVWPARVTTLLVLETSTLGGVALAWVLVGGSPTGGAVFVVVSVSSLGMGMQSALARHLAVPAMSTTVVTVALTSFMADFAALGISGPDERRWAAAWGGLFAGAAVGGAMMKYARVGLPLVTLGVLVVVLGIALGTFSRRDLSVPAPT